MNRAHLGLELCLEFVRVRVRGSGRVGGRITLIFGVRVTVSVRLRGHLEVGVTIGLGLGLRFVLVESRFRFRLRVRTAFWIRIECI